MADKKLEVTVKFRDAYVLELIETLQFYANTKNYEESDNPAAPYAIEEDYGQRVRDVLKERL